MSFKDIKGQDRPVEILKNYLKSRQIAGAYLFTGQEGIGKFLAAKNFAKAINCLHENYDACDNCPSCLKIDKSEDPDVHFIPQEGAEIIKIDYIRSLKKYMSLKPYAAKKRVFIINDAHNLNAEASNALLKILEEPPMHNLIILVTSKPGLLFKTIVSRCLAVKFYPLKREGLKEILSQDYSLDNYSAHFLAYFCEGRIGSALRLKDEGFLRNKNHVLDAFFISNKNNPQTQPSENKEELRRQLNILAAWLRDIYLVKAGSPDLELINLDRKNELFRQAERFSLDELDDMLNRVSNSILYLEQNINTKLLLANLKACLWKS